MNTSGTSLEDLYSRLSLEDEEGDGVIVAEGENVLASLWRPKEGMEVHDIGGQRYSFVFYHILDLQKVLDGGPWTFEQSLLVYYHIKDNEDPHLVPLNSTDLWVQLYDLPKGMMSENILRNIELL